MRTSSEQFRDRDVAWHDASHPPGCTALRPDLLIPAQPKDGALGVPQIQHDGRLQLGNPLRQFAQRCSRTRPRNTFSEYFQSTSSVAGTAQKTSVQSRVFQKEHWKRVRISCRSEVGRSCCMESRRPCRPTPHTHPSLRSMLECCGGAPVVAMESGGPSSSHTSGAMPCAPSTAALLPSLPQHSSASAHAARSTEGG